MKTVLLDSHIPHNTFTRFYEEFHESHIEPFIELINRMDIEEKDRKERIRKINNGVSMIQDLKRVYDRKGATHAQIIPIQSMPFREMLLNLENWLVQMTELINELFYTMIDAYSRKRRSVFYSKPKVDWKALFDKYIHARVDWEILVEPILTMKAKKAVGQANGVPANARDVNTWNHYDESLSTPEAQPISTMPTNPAAPFAVVMRPPSNRTRRNPNNQPPGESFRARRTRNQAREPQGTVIGGTRKIKR